MTLSDQSVAHRCTWCGRQFTPRRRDARTCGQRCRQASWRLRRRSTVAHVDETTVARAGASDGPERFAYADPPYPGRAGPIYQCPEVDHAALIAQLDGGGYVGWALSTAADALVQVLPLCPPDARVCAWVKPIGASTLTYGLHNCWEPLIVAGGRRRQPGVRDWLSAQPARHGGTLKGRKPIAFAAWLFDCLGMRPGDTLDDLFPGTGIVGKAWLDLSRGPLADVDDVSSRSQRRFVGEVL